MSQFKNKLLAELDNITPFAPGKVKQIMLFALLQGFMDNAYSSDGEFVRDLRLFLEDD
jgi:hypothetical protein